MKAKGGGGEYELISRIWHLLLLERFFSWCREWCVSVSLTCFYCYSSHCIFWSLLLLYLLHNLQALHLLCLINWLIQSFILCWLHFYSWQISISWWEFDIKINGHLIQYLSNCSFYSLWSSLLTQKYWFGVFHRSAVSQRSFWKGKEMMITGITVSRRTLLIQRYFILLWNGISYMWQNCLLKSIHHWYTQELSKWVKGTNACQSKKPSCLITMKQLLILYHRWDLTGG